MGMSIAHGVAAGMGGIRTAGDLVARMQMARKMRINDAKAYVAKKLNVPGCAKGIEAKVRIAELLDIEIAGVNRLKEKMKF
jgi:dimethylamine--corrinoid protein Co-methyltransferase